MKLLAKLLQAVELSTVANYNIALIHNLSGYRENYLNTCNYLLYIWNVQYSGMYH